MELIDENMDGENAGQNAPEFSVSEISSAVKRLIEGEFSYVRIKGEIGRVSRPRSGHVYLDLKDERAVISAVMWKGVAARIQTQAEEGMEVVATGRLTTFPGQSKYQLVIEDLAPAGVGALMALLEKRKAQLAAEGLFEAARKKPLPFLPQVIGVVTSPSGAVIRDILHRLRDRFPRQVLIWPVAVQGAACAQDVARAVEGFNALVPGGAIARPDLLIVARGGGSIEDLWGFNEEIVARAVASSEIPIISAVGHETDTTLIDYVSDYRAPTPTAAAERAVPVRHELLASISSAQARLDAAMSGALHHRRQRLRDMARALPRPQTLIEGPAQRLDLRAARLAPALGLAVERRKAQLLRRAGQMQPAVLKRLCETRQQRLNHLGDRLRLSAQRQADRRHDLLLAQIKRLDKTLLQSGHRQRVQSFQTALQRLSLHARSELSAKRQKLLGMDRLRESLGYRATLARGYAVIRADDTLVTRKAQIGPAARLEIEFADGKLLLDTQQDRSAQPRTKSTAKPKKTPEQGSLF